MRTLLLIVLLSLNARAEQPPSLVRYKEAPETPSNREADHVNIRIPTYFYEGPDASTEGLQCPIPHENRVKNHTGIQCVYSSIETLGRWAEEEKLTNPPLTSTKG